VPSFFLLHSVPPECRSPLRAELSQVMFVFLTE
jgi:hypothetical protein